MSEQAIAAFFDFDGTLYSGHIWQDLAKHHWRKKRHRRWVVAYVARNMAPLPLYRTGLMSQADFYRPWGETMSWMLRGWRVEEGQELFERLTEEQILPNLRQAMLDRIEHHRHQGHLVAVVSGTFGPWLGLIAQRLDIPHSIGTPLEVRDGRYTGRTVRPLCQGPAKPQRVSAYLAEQGLTVDWKRSFAYGDGGTDIPLLNEVGYPQAVYPDDVLLAHARAQGWPVIEEVSP